MREITEAGTAVELVGLKKLLYEEGCPSMAKLKAKILPSYDDIVRNY